MTTSPMTGVMLPRDLDASTVRTFARRSEELGFAELWVVEDLGFRGGIAQATLALSATETIRVGLGILPAGARNVAFAAMELASLAQLFPGRLDAGIGHGMPDWMRSVGAWPDRPLTALTAYTQGLREMLAGRPLPGAESVVLDPSSVPAHAPDLLLGVRGPKSLAVSGRIADGTVLAEPCAPAYVRAAIDQIAAGRPHRVVAYNVASVHEDYATAVGNARPSLAAIGEPDWAPHIAPLDFAEEFAQLRRRCSSPQEFASAMPAPWVHELALAGTPDQVRARLIELGEVGVTSNVLIPAGIDLRDPLPALESLALVL
ncbi:LLM class flavin-dependent oxidoreductase [Ruania halotolerans]|nr:LLM class flavin-dependent oxidoreductase [Ruania halotolerans]